MDEDREQKEPDKEAEKLFGIVEDRYGDRLSEDQLKKVKEGVEGAAELAKALRGVRLDNSVEPYSVFRPYRGEDTGE